MPEIPLKDAERGLVLSLLRQAGEEPAVVLDRIRTLPYFVASWMIDSQKLRSLYDYVVNASFTQDTVTPQIAAQVMGAQELQVLQLAHSQLELHAAEIFVAMLLAATQHQGVITDEEGLQVQLVAVSAQ